MMKKLGLDYGDRRIGVATSDIFGWTAQSLETIEHEIGEIVVGLPKNMNGSVGPRGEICIEFADKLREQFDLPVHLWDERLTTVSAERVLIDGDVSRKKRKGLVDKMAAALILQNFLDANSKR
jgi:putative Holliday junction resolvase